MTTHLDLIEQADLPRWNGEWGQRFMGVVCGITNDLVLEAASQAVLSQLLRMSTQLPNNEQPNDALDALGSDALLPQLSDSYPDYRSTLLSKWDFWTGNPMAGLLSELDRAWPSASWALLTLQDTPLTIDPDNWSAFRIVVNGAQLIPPVTGPGATRVGIAVVDRDYIGPAGWDTAEGAAAWRTYESIISRCKPVNWVNWDLVITTATTTITLMVRRRTTVTDPFYVYEA